MHRFNRFYLLGSIVFAFIVPSFTITVITQTEFIEPVVQEFQMIEQMQTSDVVFVEETEINYINYVYGLYIIVSGILCFFFIKNLLKILSKTKKNEKVSYYDATVILLKEKILPHTFLKYIFINKNEYANDQQEQLILTHELAHVKQKHSIDVLFIELLQIIFWCIPIFKLYKKAIQLNHEFLADDAVIQSHKNISEYQHILLNTSAQNNNIYLASNLNYSLTKKRLLMMTTPSSKTNILLKKLLVLPLTAGFIFAFAQRVEAQENKNAPQMVEVNNEYNNDLMAVRVEESRTSYNGIMYSYTIKNNGKKVIPSMDYSVVFKVDNKIVNFNDALPNLNSGETFKNSSGYTFYSNLKRNNITKDFDDIKPRTSINYSLEIIYNDSNIKNNTINGVSIFDKKTSQINKQEKGISKKEMKEYKTLFNSAKASKIYKQKDVQKMISLYKKMSKKQQQSVTDIRKVIPPPPPKKVQENKNIVRIAVNKKGELLVNNNITSINKLFDVLDKIDLDKNKAHVLITTDTKTKEEDILKIKKVLRESKLYKISINNKLLPPPPPLDIVQHYKQLFNKGSKSKIYKVKDVQKMISLYKKMSKKQQQSVTDIRKIVPPPPPKIDIVFTYKKLAERIQRTSKNRKANVIYLKELYGKMNASQKKQVTKPSRVLPQPPPKKKENEMAVAPVINENHASSNQWVEVVELLQSAPGKIDEKAIPPPPLLKKNATKKETERYDKAFTYWKEKTKKLPPPPPKARKATKAQIREISENKKLIEFESKRRKIADYIGGKRNLVKIKETEEQELKEAEKLRVAQEKINKSLRMRNNDPRAVVTGGKMKMSLLETVKDWRKKGARFLYNKKAVTAENAIKIVSENKNIRVYSVGTKIDEPTLVYISDKK